MSPDTALQITVIAVTLATVGLIASEIRANLQRARALDQERAEQAEPPAQEAAPFADVLTPPPEPTPPKRKRKE